MASRLAGVSRFASAMMSGFASGVTAFQQKWTGTPALFDEDWGEWEYRAGRYELLWAFYRLNQYDEAIHRWSSRFKFDYKLYADIRTVYGSGRRLGEFWASHLWGGSLDPDAGNGVNIPSALPIVQIDEKFRPSLAKLWLDSDWQSKKDVVARYGAVLGDVAIKVVDDRDNGKVRMEPLHPGKIREIERDQYGNVTHYLEVDRRADPEVKRLLGDRASYCDYACQVDLEGGEVVFQTTRNGQPYDWPDNPDDAREGVWRRPYGFVPLVLIQHIDLGQGWGDSELNGILSRTMESDALGSMLSDQVAKLLNSPWMMSGIDKINVEVVSAKTKIPVFKAPKDAKAFALVADMPVEEVRKVIESINGLIDLDYPELMVDRARSSGDMSGKTLREARKPAEAKVQSRRAAYDRGLVRAQQMALAIGGLEGYEGYEDVPTEIDLSGPLRHRVADRNVFKMDAFDRYEEQLQRATGVAAFVGFGMPVDLAMEQYDFEPDVIAATKTEWSRREAMQQVADAPIGANTGKSAVPTPEQTPARPMLERQPVT